MHARHNILIGVVAALMATCASAQAGPLTIVETNFPAVNCLFQPSCVITVSDSSGTVNLGFDSGSGFFQSRIFNSAAGTPAAGKTGYLYRLDLRGATGYTECIVGVTINFGPVTKLPYQAGSMGDVFVGTVGGLGTVKLKSADQDGHVITFMFDNSVCPKMGATAGETTFFFGLASASAPHAVTATLFGSGSPAFTVVDARAPNY